MKARVLVIDDDRLVADTLCLIYQNNGFEAEARYSAASGFERARSFAPSLMLCDVAMPDESGVQLARRVHDAMPDVQLLLLTAYPSNAHAMRAEHHPGRTPLKLLSKPCRPDDLLRETRAMLNLA